ncbi:Gfo/Idh/MocA family oxidoreductase [Candidatus Uhrbacteria bacterium]|nr:Gfo/Idh/MocA family oxidoreductase [Candidatus Uhrbacteria bacterium]
MSAKKMPKKAKRYTAVVIGAGRIGVGFDTPKLKEVLTHAHAYRRHPEVELVGICDPDAAKVSKAAKKWGTRAFASIDVMLKEVQPDLVSICVPDAQHVPVLKQVAAYKPKLVICEKPLATNLAEARAIVRLYKKFKIPLVVNLSRRFDPRIQETRTEFLKGKYGKALAATATYANGVIHNGTHMVDLLHFFFGKRLRQESLVRMPGHNRQDPGVGAFLSFEKCKQTYLIAGDASKYSIVELDLYFEKHRVRLCDFGFPYMEQTAEESVQFPGYRTLGKPRLKSGGWSMAAYHLIDNCVEHLRRGIPLICTGEDAIQTQESCTILLGK